MEFLIRITSVVFVAISPIILVLGHGPLQSLSQYWETPYQALFILSNIITSYFFFSIPKWRTPSLFLLLLTAFSVEHHATIHNLLAVIFFITCAFTLSQTVRFKNYFYLFLLAMCIMPVSLLYGEIIGIIILAGYHGKLLMYKHRLDNRHDNA